MVPSEAPSRYVGTGYVGELAAVLAGTYRADTADVGTLRSVDELTDPGFDPQQAGTDRARLGRIGHQQTRPASRCGSASAAPIVRDRSRAAIQAGRSVVGSGCRDPPPSRTTLTIGSD
jgi:hypothetical protein